MNLQQHELQIGTFQMVKNPSDPQTILMDCHQNGLYLISMRNYSEQSLLHIVMLLLFFFLENLEPSSASLKTNFKFKEHHISILQKLYYSQMTQHFFLANLLIRNFHFAVFLVYVCGRKVISSVWIFSWF